MLHLLYAVICLAVLVISAEVFVDQSLAVAKKLKISGFLIGFTLLSIGTALPDIVISTFGSARGDTEFAISTFLGSALVNTTLLIGVLSFFTKYKLHKSDVDNNIPITLGASIFLLILLLLFRFQFTWVTGIITIIAYILTVFLARKNNTVKLTHKTSKFNALILIASFVLLILTGKISTDQFLLFADQYKIADSTIGFFIVGIGISVPELVTSIEVIKRGNLQLSLGNLLGATLINILFTPALASFFNTLNFQPFLPAIFFIIFSLIMFYLLALFGKKYYITKKEGIVMLVIYILFVLTQIF